MHKMKRTSNLQKKSEHQISKVKEKNLVKRSKEIRISS